MVILYFLLGKGYRNKNLSDIWFRRRKIIRTQEGTFIDIVVGKNNWHSIINPENTVCFSTVSTLA